MYLAGVIGSRGRRPILAAVTVLALLAGPAAANAAEPGTETVTVSVTDDVSDQNPNAQSWGRVTSSPAGIDCPDDCSEDFAQGSSVELTLTRAPGYKLASWNVFENEAGPGCDARSVCSLTIGDDDRLGPGRSRAATGDAAVRDARGRRHADDQPRRGGATAGALCTVVLPLFDALPNVCAPRYPNFSSVTVTAVPDPSVPGARFVRWSDYHCPQTPTCSLSLRGDRI